MEKKIEFTGVDAGLSSMMSKLKTESQQLGSDMLSDARKYSDSQKDQLTFLEDQISAMTRRNILEKDNQMLVAKGRLEDVERKYGSGSIEANKAKGVFDSSKEGINKSLELEGLQVSLLRELVETTKLKGKDEIVEDREKVKEQIRAYEQQVSSGGYVDPIEAFKREQQKGYLAEGKQEKEGMSMFTSLLANSLMGQMGGIVKSMPSASSELDMITGTTTLMGTAGGGAIGALADLANVKVFGTGLGKAGFTTLGAEMGGQFGAFTGEAMTRSLKSRDELSRAKNIVQGLVGAGGYVDYENGGSLTSIGMDRIEQAKLSEMVARSSGTGVGLGGRTRSAAMIGKAFSLSDSDLSEQFRAGRISGGDAMGGVVRMFDKLLDQGIIKEEDRALFGQIIGTQAELTHMFGRSMGEVNSAGVQDLITGFDTWGGSFAATDERSKGNIMSLNNQLANPQNEYMQAMSYKVLKKLNPKASLFQLQMMQNRGTMTGGFLEGMIGEIKGSGLSEEDQLLMLSKMYGGYEEGIYRNALDNPSRAPSAFSGQKRTKSVWQMGKDNTSDIEEGEAEVKNMFIKGFDSGILEVSKKFSKAMGMSIDEISKALEVGAKTAFNKALGLTEKKSNTPPDGRPSRPVSGTDTATAAESRNYDSFLKDMKGANN